MYTALLQPPSWAFVVWQSTRASVLSLCTVVDILMPSQAQHLFVALLCGQNTSFFGADNLAFLQQQIYSKRIYLSSVKMCGKDIHKTCWGLYKELKPQGPFFRDHGRDGEK